MLYLVYLRVPDRPRPSYPWRSHQKMAFSVMWVLLALYFPMIVVRIANPEWRPLGYLIALQAIGLTLLGIYNSAGWRMMWHFAFPVSFFLVAVPWPRPIDAPLMDYLMQKNASIAIEGLLWEGFAAARKGNLVILPSGTVGVDEACSGIRSLQGTLMLGLFLGEMYRLGVLRRLGLLFGGAGIALLTNSIRTFWLARVAAAAGPESVDVWHDSAGYSILGINFALLWLLTVGFSKLPRLPFDRLKSWWDHVSSEQGEDSSNWVRPSPVWTLALIPMVITGFAFSAWWYDRGQNLAQPTLKWSIAEPSAAPEFKRDEISDKVLITLRHNEGWSAKWKGPGEMKIQGWYLRWEPGRNAPQLANMHDPRICLGGLGLELEAELTTWEFRTKGLVLPIQTFRFKDQGNPVHVYYGVLDDRPAIRMEKKLDNSTVSRLRAALEGRKHRGQRLIEVGVWGDVPESEARLAVQEYLTQHARVEEDSEGAVASRTGS
jgi:exosortase